MRKAIFLFVALFTGYMAGEFRNLWLMVLFVMELVLFLVSFALPFYFRGRISAELPRHTETAEKFMWLPCNIKIRNTGKLPINRFQVKFRYAYVRKTAGRDFWERGKTWLQTRYIYGSCDRGESNFQFELSGNYCGLMTVWVTRLRVYDYLALFSASKRIGEKVEVAVYPEEKAVKIDFLFSDAYADSGYAQRMSAGTVEAGSEVRQLREYTSWDSSRYIHWNQSARTGKLWVKEYEKESDYTVGLFLELTGLGEAEISGQDAFYEIVSALVLGLLEKVSIVQVSWYDEKQGCLVGKEVGSGEQSREMLLMLYRMAAQETQKGGESIERKQGSTVSKYAAEAGGQSLRLDTALRLYWKEELICTFSVNEKEWQG